MNILIVTAHSDPVSLTNALSDVAAQQLREEGHEVRISDLYDADWKAVVDRGDFPAVGATERLRVPLASGEAFKTGTLTHDVLDEQAKLLWADALILAFPLWWFSMPAILRAGSIGSIPSASLMAWANIVIDVGAIVTGKGGWRESGPCSLSPQADGNRIMDFAASMV